MIERPHTQGTFVLRSFEQDESYTITNGTVVGRELDCGICLDYAKVSRYHAKFSLFDGALFIEDLHSSNGTYLNGHRIVSRVPVTVGDEISFGDIRYRMTSGQAGTSEATQLFSPNTVHATGVVNLHKAAAPSPQMAAQVLPTSSDADHSNVQSTPDFSAMRDEPQTRLYSADQIISMAQRNLDHHADLDIGSGPRFVVLTAPLRGQVLNVGLPETGTSLTIGRDENCDIVVPEASVSRQHASITYSGLQFHIDSTASNPLLINGEVQTGRSLLRHGDKVQIGRVDVLFRTDVKREQPTVLARPDDVPTPSHYRWLIVGFALAAVALGAIALSL